MQVEGISNLVTNSECISTFSQKFVFTEIIKRSIRKKPTIRKCVAKQCCRDIPRKDKYLYASSDVRKSRPRTLLSFCWVIPSLPE